MVMALRVAIFIGRAPVVALCAAAFACAARAPDVSFTALMFLMESLPAQLLWSVLRLLYDAAPVFLHVPLPPQRVVFSALVLADWVATLVLFAAGSSATAVLVFFRVDTGACGWVSRSPGPGACSHWYGAAAALTLWACFFSAIAAVLLAWLRVAVHHEH